jgi:O-antigen/teichoic acid export membrane protein
MLLESALGLQDAPRSGLGPRLRPLLATTWRYGLSTSGPVATSGAHFLASLIFVRSLPAQGFGLFSFVLVIVPFCMSLIAAALVIPVTNSLHQALEKRAAIVATCLKFNLLLSGAAFLAVFAFLLLARAQPLPALLLALFGATLTARWFGRCFAYVQGQVHRAAASDLVYASALIASLGLLALSGHVTLLLGAGVLLASAIAGLLPLGQDFFRDQLAALRRGRLSDYAPIFRDVTRWSLLGVVFTEVTVNSHAYLVTFISGSGSFALLALGTLLMRPISLVQSALPDLERPAMTRAIAAGDLKKLRRTGREFFAALLAVWTGTLLLAGVLLTWFPQLLLKKGYGLHDVILVTLITAAIMMIRNFRTPPAVLLQAAGAFKALASIGTKSCIISLAATLGLLLAFGPIASLLGIMAGELMILFYVLHLSRNWVAQHG